MENVKGKEQCSLLRMTFCIGHSREEPGLAQILIKTFTFWAQTGKDDALVDVHAWYRHQAAPFRKPPERIVRAA